MIDWSDEALNSALDTWWRSGRCERKDMRAALDAAMTAQGCPKLPDCKTYADRAYAAGRAEAFEEAAKIAESWPLPFSIDGDFILDPPSAETIADAIRALAKEPPK